MKLIRSILVLAIFLFCLSETGYTQQITTFENRLSADFIQIDESLNYGLIFPGTGIGYDFSIVNENPIRIIVYSAGLSLNYLQTHKIAAANLHLSPVKFSWLFKSRGDGRIAVGPDIITDYYYQVYPDLQSGYSFWFTHLSIGGTIQYSFKMNNEAFRLSVESALIGLTSRPKKYEDPYFFDLDVGYVLKSVNNNFKPYSFYDYNHSIVMIRWQHRPDSRVALAYSFEFFYYEKDPKFTMFDHRMSIIFLPKKSLK